MKRIFLAFALILIVLQGCKKDDINPVTNTTANEAARDALYGLMNEWYLWYNLMPVVETKNYKDPYELINAVRYKELDRWSFVADYASFMASMQGTFVGHGIRMGLDPSNNVRIVMIYNNSPLYSKGVRRGWIVKKLNGTELAPILIAGNATEYNTLIGPSVAGITNTFLFQTPLGKDSTIATTKASFQVNSVTKYDTLQLKSGITGYLAFDEFITPSSDELKTAFAYFKQKNVKDLILDLRYNGGGILSVATELATYISGKTSSDVLVKSSYNDKKTSQNSTTYFTTVPTPLNLTRLVVITTRETASASEVVINGLKPYITVVTVGDTTNGKPTGMNVWTYTNKFVFAPITFKLVNKDNFGDFYEGFYPNKYVSDDITHDFGSRDESCVKEAIKYLETGSFSTKSNYVYSRQVIVDEKPSLINNTFVSVKDLK